MENIVEKYRECICEIDEYQNSISLGMTQRCKNKINKCYKKYEPYRKDLEVELYNRKATLIVVINNTGNIFYDLVLAVAGGFIGAVITHILDTSTKILVSFKETDPMKILYSRDDIFWISIILAGLVFNVILRYLRKDMHNARNIFKMDMAKYELSKIDEILANIGSDESLT